MVTERKRPIFLRPHKTGSSSFCEAIRSAYSPDHPALFRSSDNCLLRFFAGGDFGVPEGVGKDELPDRVFGNIERLDFVLVVERFVESLRWLNEVAPRPDLSEEESEALEARTAHDQRIYQLIVSRFDDGG